MLHAIDDMNLILWYGDFRSLNINRFRLQQQAKNSRANMKRTIPTTNFAVAVTNDHVVIGHLATKKFSAIFWLFLRSGLMTCIITGTPNITVVILCREGQKYRASTDIVNIVNISSYTDIVSVSVQPYQLPQDMYELMACIILLVSPKNFVDLRHPQKS